MYACQYIYTCICMHILVAVCMCIAANNSRPRVCGGVYLYIYSCNAGEVDVGGSYDWTDQVPAPCLSLRSLRTWSNHGVTAIQGDVDMASSREYGPLIRYPQDVYEQKTLQPLPVQPIATEHWRLKLVFGLRSGCGGVLPCRKCWQEGKNIQSKS